MSPLSTPIEFFTCARAAAVWISVVVQQTLRDFFRPPPGAPRR